MGRAPGVSKIVMMHPFFKVTNPDLDTLVELVRVARMPKVRY
jgi:hypothetical protein